MLTGCGDDDDVPAEENDPEVITDVTLIFTNQADPSDVVRASAQDPDDLGVEELMVNDSITLVSGVTYTLTFEILNAIDPNDIEDVGKDDIAEEDDEHQVFFAFTDGAFSSPMGDGNVDNPANAINYEDEDSDAQDGSGNPVGLETSWTAGSELTNGFFTAILMHQPGEKTATSSINDGEPDFDLTFVLNIE